MANLRQIGKRFGWPSVKQITSPSGSGPSIITKNIAEKIGKNLRSGETNDQEFELKTGALFANSKTDKTEAPLAIVCEFNRSVNNEVLLNAQRLAWNFSKSPLLITIEPSRIIAWSCEMRPSTDLSISSEQRMTEAMVSCEKLPVRADEIEPSTEISALEAQASKALSWINLISGSHFESHPDLFRTSQRLDSTLVSNLLCARNVLRDEYGLSERRCHDLLARLIFIQFLFQRKDSEGRPALHAGKLQKLVKDGILDERHYTFQSLLNNYEDSYSFFKWLNEHFNGDLFPGKSKTALERELEWEEEKTEVKPEHLSLLSDFIGGRVDLSDGQGFLWEAYAFDIIPLELISSIYEVFVGSPEKDKSYYTSGYLVDFMLDAVLPWNGKSSSLRILDPACGSGIFLVKAFQRLVYRWRKEHKQSPKPSDLKIILQNQIFGVDVNGEAVRVAAFSLYLAMCDELDPRQYWTRDKLFPLLREKNLVGEDFFSDKHAPFRTNEDAEFFDLIVGNAPWGKGSAKPSGEARKWAKEHGWSVPGKDLGPVFLAKAAKLGKPKCWISMIQPAGLIMNRQGPTQRFRQRLLSNYRVEEIINLAAIRRVVFSKAIGPACIVTLRSTPPEKTSDFAYVTPKPQGTAEDGLKVVIEPHDIHFILQSKAAQNDAVWSALMWGGERDLALIQRLLRYDNIDKLKNKGALLTREGVIRGNRAKEQGAICDRRFLHQTEFVGGSIFEIDSMELDLNRDPLTHSADSTDFSAFESPQLFFKQSWRSKLNRFQAVFVKPDRYGNGALCSDSYVSIHDPSGENNKLAGIWLTLNSQICPYWFALASSQFSKYIPKAEENELRRLPIFECSKAEASSIAKKGYDAIDSKVADALKLNESEKILVEDLNNVVLPDAQRKKNKPGQATVTYEELADYADVFIQVLRATFGMQLGLSASVFQSSSNDTRASLISIHFLKGADGNILRQDIESVELDKLLQKCSRHFFSSASREIGFQRVIEVIEQGENLHESPTTLYIIRPNSRRYWLRSLALRDADRLGALVISTENNV